jgi:heat shock protein HtpX
MTATGWNTFKTAALLAALTGLLVLIGGLLAGRTGMLLFFGVGVLMNIGTWWFSDSIALAANGAKEVSPQQAPELHQMVEHLAMRAGLPKPRVCIINSPTPNAFATGRDPKHAAVAVTTGIMETLNTQELAGVLSHELTHVKNRDTLISCVAATIAGAITTVANIAQWSLLWGGGLSGSSRSRDENSGSSALAAVGAILLVILAPIAATIIQFAISRTREFAADEGGAKILGDPLPLASALEKLEMGVQAAPVSARMNPAYENLYIVNPLRSGGIANLFSTHPPTAERVRRLRELATTMR